MDAKQGLVINKLTTKNKKISEIEGNFYDKDHTVMNIIKILFLKKERVTGGVITFQNTMLHMFKESPNFKLFIIDDQAKIRNKFLNYVYEFMQPRRVIHILFEYIYLMLQVMEYRKKVDYLFIPHPFKYGLFAILIASFFKIPFVVPILGWGEEELRQRDASEIVIFIRVKYELWVLRKAKYILTSLDLIKGYSKVVKNKDKFLITYSPIDTNKFKPAFKSEVLKNKLGVNNNKKIVLTAAELYGVKADGLEMLIEAFVLVKKKYGNVILLIAGDGPRKKELEDIAKKMDVQDSIRFLGYCNNMPEWINLSDIFTLIFSFGGGIGTAIKEAMACEKPCVVSRTSGTEILNNGEEVLLVNFDSKDIAEKIIKLLKDENYARRIGINAKKRIKADFSIKSVEEKLIEKLSIYNNKT